MHRRTRRRGRNVAGLATLVIVASMSSPLPTASAAPVFADGFESGTTVAWSGATRFTVQGQVVRSGGWAGRASSTGQPSHASRTFSGLGELWADVAFHVESRSTPVWLATLNKTGGGSVLRVGLNTGGRLIVRNVVAARTTTSSAVIGAGSWHELGIHLRSVGAGRFDIELDGAPVPGLAQDVGLGGTAINKLIVGDTSPNRRFVVAFDDVAVSGDPGGGPGPGPESIGRWDPLFDVQLPAIHAAVLRTGKVLLFERTSGAIGTRARLWNPATGQLENVDATSGSAYNYFCSGHSVLADGRVFITGGTTAQGNPYGERRTALFDPLTQTWSPGPTMANARWYPSNLTLPDRDVLIFSGQVDPDTITEEIERYDPDTNTLSTLAATADMASPYLYPRVFLLDDGTVVRVGMDRRTMYLDPETERWTQGPQMVFGSRANGSTVLLPGERVLAIGGRSGGLPTRTAETIDLGAGTPVWRSVGSMAEPRQHFNAVLLPDGTVLAIGGTRSSDNYGDPVFLTERYDPATERWTPMDVADAPRAYHSTAVLLPDGRVLSAGQTSGSQQTTAQVYSPPYLFAGPRPAITAAPSSIGYGGTFSVSTGQAGSIDDVVLIRAASVTHGVNFDQRSVPMPFSAGAGSLSVQAPGSAVDAPPGWYMLFVLDGGVPSVARWVRVG